MANYIGIIVAMKKELDLVLSRMEKVERISRHSETFYHCQDSKHHYVVMQCGIGKVNAAMGATLLSVYYQPNIIINTGVAAGIGKNLQSLDVVVADKLAHHDFWCLGEEWGRVPEFDKFFPACVPEVVESLSHIYVGTICSGEKFIDSTQEVATLRERFPDALAVDMESSAIAQVCTKQKIPFLCLRVISDTPGAVDNNANQYDQFWQEAPLRSFSILNTLLEIL